MCKYILRLDDACEKRDIANWDRMETLCDRYGVRPLVGVIPHCEDPKMQQYPVDDKFWNRVVSWRAKGWAIAMHGYNHVYVTKDGGINPVNHQSEFVGLPLDVQKQKIHKGLTVFQMHGLQPRVFFAPSHTFDLNTLEALRTESDIRIISDTVASRPYQKYGFTFVPQQSGHAQRLPVAVATFCYHPNGMSDASFSKLEIFFQSFKDDFISFPLEPVTRKRSLYDTVLEKMYFARRN